MKIRYLFNSGVRIALLWFGCVLLFGVLFVNRINLSGDTAYQWIDSGTYVDTEGIDIFSQLHHWDAKWFTNLSRTGYVYKGLNTMSNVVFFPLYPLAIATFHFLTTIPVVVSGVLLSLLFTVVAAGLLYNLASQYVDTERANFSVYAFLTFPTAIFLVAPYSESLFLLLSLLFLFALKRQQFFLAFTFGVLASLTRSIGFLLVIFAIAYAWQHWKTEKRWKVFLPILLPLGTLSFFVYEKIRFGSFFTYFHIESVWGRAFTVNWDHLWLVTAAAKSQLLLDLGMLLFVLTCGVFLLRKKLYAFAIYAVLLVLLPVSTGTLMSVGRYALAAFPIFLIPALVRSSLVRATWLFVSVLLFGMTMTLFLQNHWAG